MSHTLDTSGLGSSITWELAPEGENPELLSVGACCSLVASITGSTREDTTVSLPGRL